jgi:sigma-E factor negative regulatory protein RseA
MKQKISILMDGELSVEETELLLLRIKQHPEARQGWQDFHLISDALRQPDFVHKDISASIFERLKNEPTVLAPNSKRNSKTSYFAMSAVASIMAMAFLAWLSVQIDSVPLHQQALQAANEMRPANLPVNEKINDYLLAHQEYSPSTDMRGASSYIRTVSFRQAGAGQ